MVATPVLVLAMSGIYIGERITWESCWGGLGAGGALTLVRAALSGSGSATLLYLFILVNASSFAIYGARETLDEQYTATTVWLGPSCWAR